MTSFLAFGTLALSSILASAAPLAENLDNFVSCGWYTGYHASKFPLSDVSWNKYTRLSYSFAVATDPHTISLDGSDPSLLPQFVSEARAHNVQATVTIGGWTGSRSFSSNLASAGNRVILANTVKNFITKYDLAGVDFDWEYPNSQGIGCNTISPEDTSNFLSFLQQLRTLVGSNVLLTATTLDKPWNGPNGNPLTDVSGFAQVLDYIEIMNYDVWGSFSNAVGPNSPLDDTCAPSQYRDGSAVSAVKAWEAAGMPRSKIVLGVAAYGHSYSVSPSNAFVSGTNTLASYPPFDASRQPLGDSWDDDGGNDICGKYEGPGGTFDFWGLVEGGFLTQQGSPAPGIYYRYDSCSQTPYVYNRTSEVMVSFDNAQSFAAKRNFIAESGLRGFAMWEAGGDYHNILLNSITGSSGGGSTGITNTLLNSVLDGSSF